MAGQRLAVATEIALAILRFYKKHISARLNRMCRYEPSCSEYARLAILKYGLASGTLRAARRLLSCGQWSRRPYIDYP